MEHQESPMLTGDDVVERDFEGLEPSKAIESTTLADPENVGYRPDVSWLPRIFSAATTGGLAVVGQGLFAGSHFLVNVLLARWLPPEQYGAFALAYAAFLLFFMLYNACVYEPLIVFGSGRYAGRFQEYFRLLVRGNVLVLVALSCLMFGTSFLLRHFFPSEVARDFAALSLAAPFVLVTWLGRGGFYARMKPGEAAWGGAFYFFTLLAAMIVLRLVGRLSGSAALLSMGLAGLTSNAFLFSRFRIRWRGDLGSLRLKQVWGDHWSYGRWALASAVVSWFPQNIYYALLPASMGLEGAAALRALTNLINPIIHMLIALSAVLIPALVRHHEQGGITKMKMTMRTLIVLLIPGSAVYLLALWLGRSVLFQFLYAGKYQQYNTWPLLLTALVPIATTVVMILGSALRALEKPDRIFWSYVAATATALLLGLPLTMYRGVIGATGALLTSSIVAAALMAWFFRQSALEEAKELL
jgi:O-antigen/teichoic acid export membrane protein